MTRALRSRAVRRLPLAAGTFAALAGCAAILGAQAPDRFRSGVEIVTVTATVTDGTGRLVTGLAPDDFEVFENGQLRPVTQFTHERVPVSLGVLLDISDSMYGARLRDARAALERFLFDLLGPDDEYFLLLFNHRPSLVSPWTRDREATQAQLTAMRPWGGTAIYDAMMSAIPLFERRARQRAAAVVISDGADTASDHNLREVRSLLLRSDAFVYAIAIDPPERRAINTRVNPYALREITDDSGGYTAVVHDTAEIGAATQAIAEELNRQYTLGYTPAHPPDNQFRRIRVKVKAGDYTVRARRGYVATQQRRW